MPNVFMPNVLEKKTQRVADHPIDDIFINRWSPRAMAEEEVTGEELMSLFEAARWAPSSYNNQPWRFIYAHRETLEWNILFDLLNEQNQAWAKNAGVLVLIVSKTTFDKDGKPSWTHSFDAGAAWQNFALQGFLHGLVVHGMQGFDYQKAREVLCIPEGHTVEAMAAVGRRGRTEDLAPEMQKMEFPNGRKKLSEFVFRGRFGGI